METSFLLSIVIVAAPLLLAAVGELVSERAGVLNIGIEGLMLVGCFVAFAVTLHSGSPWWGMIAAPVAGGVVAFGLASIVVRLGADSVVAGSALNILALGVTAVAYRALVGVDGKAVMIDPLPGGVLPGVGIAAAWGVAWFLSNTRPGLELRACGEDPNAARAVGIDVMRMRIRALVFAGMMAGMAGAQLCLVQARTFGEGMTAGRGFLALAVVVCGGWTTRGTLIAGLLFGGATALQYHLQTVSERVPYQLLLMLPYLVTLVLLVAFASRNRAPEGLGDP